MEARPHRAGETTPDLCRACKITRDHTVMAVDPEGRILRVVCDYCRSEHNYRGGGDERTGPAPAPRLASQPERTDLSMNASEEVDPSGLEPLLRRVLREELGLTRAAPAEKWRGGEMILRPGKPGLQEKKWPLDTFFNKVVMVRNRLRTLEQQVNDS